MKNLVESEFDKTYTELDNCLAEAAKNVNYYSADVRLMQDLFNAVFTAHKLPTITLEDGILNIFTAIWKMTIIVPEDAEVTAQELADEINEIGFLPLWVQASVKLPNTLVLRMELDKADDNQLSLSTLNAYKEYARKLKAGEEITDDDKKVADWVNEIEGRMYRRDGDNRKPEHRMDNMIFGLEYENALLTADLVGIKDLRLRHENDKLTIRPDTKTDFMGTIVKNGVEKKDQEIEGKSYRLTLKRAHHKPVPFKLFPENKSVFAELFKELVDNKLFGELHNADYVLFVNRLTKQVICVNAQDYEDCWEAYPKLTIN